MKTIHQRLAADVYWRVMSIYENHDEKYHKKYGTMAHKMPVLVHTAGLMQAIAFVHAKGAKNEAWKQFLNDLAQTLEFSRPGYDGDDLLQDAQKAEIGNYILLTRRVSNALLWYKRFAESILKVEPGHEDNEEEGTP
ncbi:MAG TPA: type III-B CRISPR module-associated protein Cmr5 [Anaerolineae bacterium]|nr:type III-B CRISPR module-associated protein Cmr5 [Anaerolineae bacterium]